MFETLTERLSSAFSFLRGKKELTEENIDEGLRQVRQALLEADVNYKVVGDFVERVRARVVGQKTLSGVDPSQQFVGAFHKELVELLGGGAQRVEFAKNGPTVVLMAGLQGAGKTTTCAKLAKFYREKHGKRPLLVAADVKRPAAVEQLQVLGKKLGLPVFHEPGLGPIDQCVRGVAAARVGGNDLVILDTAGRLHVDAELMDEVAAIARATNPNATLLVVDAMSGQDAVSSAQAFHAKLALTGVVLTKTDGDARGGAAVSLRAVTGRPILFVGTGETIDALDAFHPDRMAGRILGMGDVVGLVEKAQAAIDEKEAQRSVEKMVMGDFTLEDMLAQLRMLRKLGPMKKVLGMLPGMGDIAKQINIDDKQMNRLEALFTSMTPRERLQPDVLDMSRRRRIARGAGQEVAAVNELLKRYKDMKLVMKQMGKMGLASQLGSKEKAAALRQLGGGAPTGGSGGGLLGGMFGGGGGGGAGGFPGLGGLGGMGGKGLPGAGVPGAGLPGGSPLGARPMGQSSTRQSGKKKDKKKRR